MELLKFSPGKGNAKLASLGGKVYTFSLSSGWSCPAAHDCLSKAVAKDGKMAIKDGPHTKFRCFSATQEVVYKAVRDQRQHNFDLLRKANKEGNMPNLIEQSLPKDATIVRIHVGGDFFNKDYMSAWLTVARLNPTIIFYAYTKSLHYWIALMSEIPANMKLNASKGGKFDHFIDLHGLKYAEVVYTEQEAIDKGLEIDHDDSHAFLQDKSFALLLHGVQPKGSAAGEALKALKGVGSYSFTKKPEDATIKRKRTNKSLASV